MRAWRAIDELLYPSAAKSWWFAILRHENFRRFCNKTSQLEV